MNHFILGTSLKAAERTMRQYPLAVANIQTCRDLIHMNSISLTKIKHDKVCFVGASHAYWLDHKGTDLLKQLGINTVLVDWFPKNQIRFFKEEDLQYLSSGKNCTKVVIGFGQWDLGDWLRRTDDPTTFLDYYTSLSTLMQWIQALKHDKDASGMEIFFQSTQ